jgi:hypothetical protein
MQCLNTPGGKPLVISFFFGIGQSTAASLPRSPWYTRQATSNRDMGFSLGSAHSPAKKAISYSCSATLFQKRKSLAFKAKRGRDISFSKGCREICTIHRAIKILVPQGRVKTIQR